jgi:uncharacterized protein YecE (DUF72 family)
MAASDNGSDPGVLARLGRASEGSNLPKVHIGTSGWHYMPWRGPFYPETMKPKDFLSFYVTRFATAELNNPFYRLPTEAAVQCWRDTTPDTFLFAWKASRYITHMLKLKNAQNGLDVMFSRAEELGPKLGPILFQLPPSLKVNRERLADFLKILPAGHRYTFEFRHSSWYEPRILDLLREHDASLCLSDHAAAPAPWEVTASFVYVRGHGPSGRYWGSYSDETLAKWAEDIGRWREEGRAVFCYFDNDIKSAAPEDARRLVDLIGADAVAMPQAPAAEAITTPPPPPPRRGSGRDRRDAPSRPPAHSPEPLRSPGSRAR